MSIKGGRFLFPLIAGCCFGPFAQAATSSPVIEVPFDFDHNAIIVQATVNGKGPFNMLLDTGADPSVIDLGTAKEIGLKLTAEGEQGTGGGTDANLAYETRLPLLEVGGLAASGIEAVAMDLSKPGQALGRPIHGVLGQSFLNHRVVQIDYPQRVVRFYANSRWLKRSRRSSHSKIITLSFRYRDDILVGGVMVNGKKVVANLDTGSSGSFQLTPAAVTELGLEAEAGKARVSQSTGFNGTTENREGNIGNVSIGGIFIDEPTVVFYGKGTGRDNEAWGIRIGNAFLKGFVVTIDYPGQTVTLQRP
jgi:predicted aspartyl protease